MNLVDQFKNMVEIKKQAILRPDKARRGPIIKRKSVRLLVGFFAVMAVLTVLSRIADTLIVAKVSATMPKRGALTYEIDAQGEIELIEELSIASEPGLRVTDICVEAGQEVKTGDRLVAFDVDDISEQLFQAESELQKLELQKRQQELSAGLDGSTAIDAQAALEYTQKEAELNEQSASRTVEAAQEDLDRARKAYQDAVKNKKKVNREERQQAVNDARESLDAAQDEYNNVIFTRDNALREVQRTVEDAQDALEEAQQDGDSQAIESAQTALDRAMEDERAAVEYYDLMVSQAQEKIDNAQAALTAAENDTYDAGSQLVKSTRNTLDNAKRALQDAVDAQTKQYTADQHAIENARQEFESAQNSTATNREQADIQQQSIDIDIGLKEREVERLRELKENNSITAPVDGMILSIGTEIGNRTSGDEIILMGSYHSGYKFRTLLDRELAEHIKIGDIAELTIKGEKIPVQGVIESIYIKNNEERAEITASLPEGSYPVGVYTKMEIDKRSENYTKCIPIGAVRKDTDGEYVLMVQETNTVLGKEYTVARAAITVLDHDSTTAAVSGGIYSDDMIITGSNKPIGKGDRVRLTEE